MSENLIVRMDGRGQVVIPQKIRKKLGFNAFWISIKDGKIVLEGIKPPK